MKKRLIIIGASGHGKVIADTAGKINCYYEIVFVDDDETIQSVMQYKCIGNRTVLQQESRDADIIVAIGNATIRERFIEEVEELGFNIPTLIHPNAVIGSGVKIGKGTVVMAGTVINSDSEIGKGVIINTSSSVDHDCNIGDYVHISVGAHVAGTVVVGKNSWIGVGATVSNNLSICEGCIVGAGAVVVRNIDESGIYVGVPAERIEMKKKNTKKFVEMGAVVIHDIHNCCTAVGNSEKPIR